MARKTKQISDIEALPESDRLEGFPHPREVTDIVGHQNELQQLINAWQSRRMHHAWILCGKSGIGKATCAYHLARIILSYDMRIGSAPPIKPPEEASQTNRQILALSHPNLLLIRRPWKDGKFKTVITVDEVRRLKGFINMTAEEGRWRVVIIDRANEMNISAANALLKSLEEPPANCVFFLITESVGRMPATIQSRCRRLDFAPLNNNDLRRAVQNSYTQSGLGEFEKSKLDILSQISGGSVRQTLELAQGKGLENYEKLIKIFKSLPKIDYSEVHDLAEKLSGAAALPEFEMFYSLFSDFLRRIIRVGAGSGEAPEAEIHIALKFVTKDTLAQWAELWETVAQARTEALGLNLDRKNFLIETFHKVEQTAKRSAG